MTNAWTDPAVAQAQRALVDAQLQQSPPPPHLRAYASAIRDTQCPGEILEVGCASGYGVEILNRAGVPFRSYAGIDISEAAIAIAKERYPESLWLVGDTTENLPLSKSDVIVDSACLMHIDSWKEHLAMLCRASRRHVILHRVPFGDATERTTFSGYGHDFPAWRFAPSDVVDEMQRLGFMPQMAYEIGDPGARTLTFAKSRHWVTYADSNYLTRLKALHASMVRHAGPFVLHVLAWDDEVFQWGLDHEASDGTVNVQSAGPAIRDWKLDAETLPGPLRSRVEHMWTVGPAWIAEVMKRTREPVTYVDADVMFFSSPEPVFAEIVGAPAAVVPHGFAKASQGLPGPTMETHWPFGAFNVGLVHIADRSVAETWAKMCRNWCYDRVDVDAGLYGDQRYLEGMVHHMRAHVVAHPGACAGPWQVHCRSWGQRDGVIHFGNRPLVSYHYSGYRELPDGHTVLTRPEYALTRRHEDLIYSRYIEALEAAKR